MASEHRQDITYTQICEELEAAPDNSNASVAKYQRRLSRHPAPNIDLEMPPGWDNDTLRTFLMLTDYFVLHVYDFPEEFDDHWDYLQGLWYRFAEKIDEFGFDESETKKFKVHLLGLIGTVRDLRGEYQNPHVSLTRVRERLPENQRCLLDGLLSHLTDVDAEEARLMIINWTSEVETCLSENHGWPI